MNIKRPRINHAGLEEWECSLCKERFSYFNFYQSKKARNGLSSHCRKCHTKTNLKTRDVENSRRICREHMKRARIKNPEKFKERERLFSIKRTDKFKRSARYLLNYSVRRGEVIRPNSCENCNKIGKVNGHHTDYSTPLKVEWLCNMCHAKRHHKIK